MSESVQSVCFFPSYLGFVDFLLFDSLHSPNRRMESELYKRGVAGDGCLLYEVNNTLGIDVQFQRKRKDEIYVSVKGVSRLLCVHYTVKVTQFLPRDGLIIIAYLFYYNAIFNLYWFDCMHMSGYVD